MLAHRGPCPRSSDADLERIVNADDPQVALCDVAERRWGSDWSAGRGWLGRAVAEYATLHLPPEHREAIAILAVIMMGHDVYQLATTIIAATG